MTLLEALQRHQAICDELHRLALEENRFLQQHRRVPDPPLLERKRLASVQLDEALAALRAAPAGGARDPQARAALEASRARILQILQIEKDNEQLLLRYSLSGTTVAPGTPAASPGMLQKIYARHQQ
jgi:hypothetical protein